MEPILYNINRIEQGLQDCAQTNVLQLLNYKNISKTKEDILREVPVYINSEGVSLGSSIGHIATYLSNQGFVVTLHVADIQIFDRSMDYEDKESLLKYLAERVNYIKHPSYGVNEFKLIFDGYIQYIKSGGLIKNAIFKPSYLYNILSKGPFLAIVSYQFLNGDTKYSFNLDIGKPVRDTLKGVSGTHVVTVIGYKDNSFIIADPDLAYGGIRTIEENHLIGSIYIAETDYDSMVISVE